MHQFPGQYQQQHYAPHGAYPLQRMPGVWTCPYCGAQGTKGNTSKTSTAGWIVFFVLLFTTCIGAPLGFLLKDHHEFCRACNSRVA